MQTNEIGTEELSARTDRRHRIGVDSKGRDHYADAQLGRVWVTVENEIAHVESTSVSQWVEYVDDVVGWESCTYDDRPLGEWLTDALTEGAA